MVQAAHGVEGVSGAACPRAKAGLALSQCGIAMAKAAHHPETAGMLNQFERGGKLGSDRQYADIPRAACQKRSKSDIDGCTSRDAG